MYICERRSSSTQTLKSRTYRVTVICFDKAERPTKEALEAKSRTDAFGDVLRAMPTAPDSYILLLRKSVNGLPVTNGVDNATRPTCLIRLNFVHNGMRWTIEPEVSLESWTAMSWTILQEQGPSDI